MPRRHGAPSFLAALKKTAAGMGSTRRPRHECARSGQPLEPIVDLIPGLILRVAIALLNLAFELIALAVDLGQIIIGEFAPLLLDLAGELFPVTLDAIPIHENILRVRLSLMVRPDIN